MGWLSDVTKKVFGGGDDGGGGGGWGDVIGGAVDLAGNIVGNQQANAGRKASSKAAKRANAAANARLQTIVDSGAPSRNKLMQISAQNPYILTPEQQIGREDNLRSARTNLAASGLRGAGRAGVGLINDSDRRYMAQVISANLGRSDAAMNKLSGDQLQALTGQATGDRALGTTQAVNELGVGQNDAAGTVGNAKLVGSTLGALASVIAGENKSSYQQQQPKV